MSGSTNPLAGEILFDLVLEKASRGRCVDEAPVHFGRDPRILDDRAAREFHLEDLRARVVTNRADAGGVDAHAFHYLRNASGDVKIMLKVTTADQC